MNKKLFKAVIPTMAMLLIAIMSLTGVTYAWFTQTDKATIDTLDLKVTSASAMLVATAANANTNNGWKSQIGWNEINGAFRTHLPANKDNMTCISTRPTASSGALSFFTAEIDTSTTIMNAKPVVTSGERNDDYYMFDLYIWNDSTTDNKTVTLKGSTVDKKTGSEIDGAQDAIRIAVLRQGSAGTGSGAYTGGTALPAISNDATFATIWEPNAGDHTPQGIQHASEIGTQSATVGSVTGYKYYAISGSHADAFPEYSAQDWTDLQDASASGSKIKYEGQNVSFTIDASKVTKITVYIWFEGQDVDCTNAITSGDVSINLVLDATGV